MLLFRHENGLQTGTLKSSGKPLISNSVLLHFKPRGTSEVLGTSRISLYVRAWQPGEALDRRFSKQSPLASGNKEQIERSR